MPLLPRISTDTVPFADTAALQIWARAMEQTKSLNKKTVAEAIRGKTIKGTLVGNAMFLPNGR